MTDEPAAFKAVFVKCHQVRDEVYFTFSVPSEYGTQYLDSIGGFPKPGESRWFAIAQMQPTKEDKPQELQRTRQTLEKSPARPHNPFSRRAGIRSNDPEFQRFIGTPDVDDKAAYAASYIRIKSGVTSRKDILPGTQAAVLFERLESEFIAWRDGMKHGAA